MAEVKEMLGFLGLDRVEGTVQVMPTTTEISTAPQVFGRDTERDQVMEMLGVTTVTIDRADEINQVITQMLMPASPGSVKRHKGNSSSSARSLAQTADVSVLPIFGIGGMGKTTLAQLIYNDERVISYFTARIWVCVSDLFDIERMTKEIFNTICNRSCGLLGGVQTELKEQLKSQKFLLVLDDIWQITPRQWESFYAPLGTGLEGSMILVTTRHENIARLVATSNCNPVQLQGLPSDIFWEFFKKCAFGKERPDSYARLQEIGRSISSRLCGSPLAAKTLGRLLNSNLTEQHWMAINDSELWQQEQKEGDILPALRLSYLYLTTELRRCFAFCSIFPKDYCFKRREIVDIWVAQGFVAPQKNMCPEDEGVSYFDKLRHRCLFQPDPKYPNHDDRYVMHDLIHDTAQYVSMHECFSMKDLSGTIHVPRHMSVEVDGKSLSTMSNVPHLSKLRSLRFGTKLDVEIAWFSKLSNIVFLSLEGCRLKNLPQSICELNSLRYLDISFTSVEELTAKFCRLYKLQVIDESFASLKKIHEDVTKLTNLRRLELPERVSISFSKLRGLGKLSCLRNLSYFTVGRWRGAISELKGMNQLRGTLSIRSIQTVKNKEEAVEAKLSDKKHLKELDLHWRINPRTACKPSSNDNEVADGLCPNKRIECLKIHGFWGDRLPSWFNPNDLQNLRSLQLFGCPYFETLSIPHSAGVTQGGSTGQHESNKTNCGSVIASFTFTHITSISIVKCNGLKNLDQFLSPKNLPSVESILLEDSGNLESLPSDRFVEFVRLQDLKLRGCGNLVCQQPREMVLPPSLRRLCIVNCGQLDRSFPSCLEKLTSLTALSLTLCKNIESIPLDLISCRNSLKFLVLQGCSHLSSIGGLGVLSSIEFVNVEHCPKLTQIQQPYERNALLTMETETRRYLNVWF